MANYGEEQKRLKEETAIAEEALNTVSDRVDTLQKFIDKVKKITQPTELTAKLVHEFIDKIIVHAPRYLDGQRYQIIDIYYNGIGVIRGLSPEETEEAFQKRLEQIKSKTA